MKLFQNARTAWLLTAVMIAAAVGIGLSRNSSPVPDVPAPSLSSNLDRSLSTSEYSQWIWDDAGILSSKTEKEIELYNANWDYRYNSVVAIVTTKNPGGSLEDFAWDQGVDMGLGESDAVLAISVRDKEYYLFSGDDFSSLLTNKAVSDLEDALSGKLDDKGVLAFYETLNQVYLGKFGLGNAQDGYSPGYHSGGSRTSGVIMLAVLLIALLVVINAIDRSRYNTYRRRYYGVVNPPVMFRPIFFWHGPGTGWYRRHWRQPPPPQPPRGSGGPRPSGTFGGTGNRGPRGGGTFGGRPSGGGQPGGFGGFFGGHSSGGSRGGSFGGRPSGGSRGGFFGGRPSGGSRGGSFGGRPSGGSRGGSFGGRPSGGSRGGSFGGRPSGGSRGGSFGGRR